jgi:hypothetical protein
MLELPGLRNTTLIISLYNITAKESLKCGIEVWLFKKRNTGKTGGSRKEVTTTFVGN